MHQRPRRRQSIALALSVVLHVALLWTLVRFHSAPRPTAPRGQTLAIQMIDLPAPVRPGAKKAAAPVPKASASSRP